MKKLFRISKSTGSQFEHEHLFRTVGGKFVLNVFSDYQGRNEYYYEISAVEAAEWFSKNELDPQFCENEFAELEIP